MRLKDPKLFRQQCYIDGKWVDAGNREIPARHCRAAGGLPERDGHGDGASPSYSPHSRDSLTGMVQLAGTA